MSVPIRELATAKYAAQTRKRNKIDTAGKVADVVDLVAEVAEVAALGGRRRTHKKKRGIRKHRKYTHRRR